MKKFNSSRRKLQLSRTTIRQLGNRHLSRINGGTLEGVGETTETMMGGNAGGGDDSATIDAGCDGTMGCN